MRSAVSRVRCRMVSTPTALPAAVIAGDVEVGRFGAGEEVRWVGDLRATRWTFRWRCGRARGSGHVTAVPLSSRLAELVVVLEPPRGLRAVFGRSSEDLAARAGQVARIVRDVIEGRPDAGPHDGRVEAGREPIPLTGAALLAGSADGVRHAHAPGTRVAPAVVART